MQRRDHTGELVVIAKTAPGAGPAGRQGNRFCAFNHGGNASKGRAEPDWHKQVCIGVQQDSGTVAVTGVGYGGVHGCGGPVGHVQGAACGHAPNLTAKGSVRSTTPGRLLQRGNVLPGIWFVQADGDALAAAVIAHWVWTVGGTAYHMHSQECARCALSRAARYDCSIVVASQIPGVD